MRVSDFEKRERFGGVDEPEDAEADKDGGVDADDELEVWERGKSHCNNNNPLNKLERQGL